MGRKVASVTGIILPFFLQAVKLTSSRTQLPYEYYSLPFCQPTEITYKAENLGMYLLMRVLPSNKQAATWELTVGLEEEKQLAVSSLISCGERALSISLYTGSLQTRMSVHFRWETTDLEESCKQLCSFSNKINKSSFSFFLVFVLTRETCSHHSGCTVRCKPRAVPVARSLAAFKLALISLFSR